MIVFTEQTLQQPRVIVVREESWREFIFSEGLEIADKYLPRVKSTGVWSAPKLMENRARRVYPLCWITTPPTRRSPLAEGRTSIPNPSVAIEHHWFALHYCISFSSLHSCYVPIVVSDQSQFFNCLSDFRYHIASSLTDLLRSVVQLWFHSCYINSPCHHSQCISITIISSFLSYLWSRLLIAFPSTMSDLWYSSLDRTASVYTDRFGPL